MSRFVACSFYHAGRSEWLDSYLNLDQIARAQPDVAQPKRTRVWLIGDDMGFLTAWTWDEAATVLGVVDGSKPTEPQAAALNVIALSAVEPKPAA